MPKLKANQFYCVRDRKAVTAKNMKEQRDRRGRLRLTGICNQCGGRCYKYISES